MTKTTATETVPGFVVTLPARTAGRAGKVHAAGCRHIKPLTLTRPARGADFTGLMRHHHCPCVAKAAAL